MPRVHDVEDPQGGPGSAFHSALSSKSRRRRKKMTASNKKRASLIGQDLFDFDEDIESPATTAMNPSLQNDKKQKDSAEPKPKRLKKKQEASSQQEKNASNNKKRPHVTPSITATNMQSAPLVSREITPTRPSSSCPSCLGSRHSCPRYTRRNGHF